MSFQAGQAWVSEAEPELGVGFVRDQDFQVVVIEFPAAPGAPETRRYGKRSAPLRRLEFRVGEAIRSAAGARLTVARVEARGPLLWYVGEDGSELVETELSPQLRLQRPMQRFLAGQWDALAAFELRRGTLGLWHRQLRAPVRGLIGPRARLLPHQLYVVDQISRRAFPRALLADEVGLGKTIEAGWILHRLWVTGQARRALVIAPGALVNQWFVEMFRRFNASFWVPDSQSEEGIRKEDLLSQERVILSLESLDRLESSGALEGVEFDLVIVDEAHRVAWSPGDASIEYRVLERLAAASQGLLLLTATPEQLGLEGHFARLRLIDPARFASFEAFRAEHGRYRELAGKLGRELGGADRAQALALVDQHGTGRVYFRNSRQVVELEHCFFPRRKLETHGLAPGASKNDDPVARWLGGLGRARRAEREGAKTLVICSSSARAIELERALREEHGLKAVAFHEGMPLLARDRAAAYFEDPQGAAILVCSEIGGEGRNFQHADQLVLADLPSDPDVLEQRIGRLDRIGQGSDIVIHVPYLPGSAEERLLRWHRDVFGAFDRPPRGAGVIHARHRGALEAASGKDLDALIALAAREYAAAAAEIEQGRDRLIELNSFDPAEGTRLAAELASAERPAELRAYLEKVLDTLGVHMEDLDADSLFAEPGDTLFVSYFPALPAEGIRMTFSREKALAREDLTLMSWDHPMVTGTMEAIASQEMGNSTLATWIPAVPGAPSARPRLLVDCLFVLETGDAAGPLAPALAIEPIRVVLEGNGTDVTAAWAPDALKAALRAPTPEVSSLARKLPADGLRRLLTQGVKKAEALAEKPRAAAVAEIADRVKAETARLKKLQALNGLVSAREILWWEEQGKLARNAVAEARVRLDSFVLVLEAGE